MGLRNPQPVNPEEALSQRLITLEQRVSNLEGALTVTPFVAVEALNKIGAGALVRIEQGGFIGRLAGEPQASAEIPTFTRIFTLPTGYRPQTLVRVPFVNASAGTFNMLTIAANGEVSLSAIVGSGSFIGFDGITFPIK